MEVDGPFSAEVLELAEESKQYHTKMVTFIEHVLSGRYTADELKEYIPQKPKEDLLNAIYGKPTVCKALTGKDLHEYLKSLLIVNTDHSSFSLPQGEVDIQQILQCLQTGWKILKQGQRQILKHSLEYGWLLEKAFHIYSLCRLAGNTMQSKNWKDWLEKHVGISAGHARKLREMHKLFKNYPKLHNLGISFSELYSRRKYVEQMLEVFPDINCFWSQATEVTSALA